MNNLEKARTQIMQDMNGLTRRGCKRITLRQRKTYFPYDVMLCGNNTRVTIRTEPDLPTDYIIESIIGAWACKDIDINLDEPIDFVVTR